jgi:hypothetical protein
LANSLITSNNALTSAFKSRREATDAIKDAVVEAPMECQCSWKRYTSRD